MNTDLSYIILIVAFAVLAVTLSLALFSIELLRRANARLLITNDELMHDNIELRKMADTFFNKLAYPKGTKWKDAL